MLAANLCNVTKSFSRFLNRNFTTRTGWSNIGAWFEGGCFDVVFDDFVALGDTGLGLGCRFPMLFAAVALPSPDFFVAADALGRGERTEDAAGSFFPAVMVLEGRSLGVIDGLLARFVFPVDELSLAFSSLRSLSSSANASSMIFGSVGLSNAGNVGRE